MQKPLELTFRDVPRSPHLEELIRSKVARLEKFCDYVIGCRVLVERHHKANQAGGPRHLVRINLTVPAGHEIVVTKDGRSPDVSDDLRTVLNRAFQAAERELKKRVARQRGEVKTHAETMGEKGAQATTVQIVKKPGSRIREGAPGAAPGGEGHGEGDGEGDGSRGAGI